MKPAAAKPHIRITHSFIDDNLPKIGVYGMGVCLALLRYLNTTTGQCNPSYKTLARKIGIDRGTVIRYVKKLTALQILSPELRFKDDGSQTSNQYTFLPECAPANQAERKQEKKEGGGGSKPPPLVAEDNQGSGTEPPEQSFPNKKKERTITEVDLMPTERQQTCPHPPEYIVILPDNITICNHCYGLLDENLTLQEEEKYASEIVAA
jgi:hypothetical protein